MAVGADPPGPALTSEQSAQVAALRAALSASVHDDLLRGGEEGLTELTLRRWLTARKWNLEDAVRDLKAHAAWRVEFAPRGRVLEDEVVATLAQNKVFLPGADREGRGVVFLLASSHVALDAVITQRSIAYIMDAAIRACDPARNPLCKTLGIFDLRGYGKKNWDFRGLRSVFDMLAAHYPERLSCLVLYGAGALFTSLWKMVEPFVDPVTRKKVVFVAAGPEGTAHLQELMEPQVLPEPLGGQWRLTCPSHAVARLYGLPPPHSAARPETCTPLEAPLAPVVNLVAHAVDGEAAAAHA